MITTSATSNTDTTAFESVVAHNVSKILSGPGGSLVVLNGINLCVLQGQSAAILGVSGSGKSTLLGLLAGLEPPSGGQIRIDGQSLSKLSDDEHADLRATRVGFIFQNFQLLPNLTAWENVMLPLDVRGVERESAKQRVSSALDRVGLQDRISHYPSQLSGGEQQRVAIARACVGRPCVLFADEPTGNLDQETGKHIEDLLFELNAELGTTLIIVTHNGDFAARCQRCFTLTGGELQESGLGSTGVEG